MKQSTVFILLGVVQIVLLTLFGLYFYRSQHADAPEVPQSPADGVVQNEVPLNQ